MSRGQQQDQFSSKPQWSDPSLAGLRLAKACASQMMRVLLEDDLLQELRADYLADFGSLIG